LFIAIVLVTGVKCGSSTGPNGGGGAGITTDAQAKAAFGLLKSVGAEVDQQVETDFSGPVSISGTSGTAAVTGEKTSSSTNSNCCVHDAAIESDD
jgi:hypothetical protein